MLRVLISLRSGLVSRLSDVLHQKAWTKIFLINIPFEHSFAPWLPSKIWSTMKVFLFYFFSRQTLGDVCAVVAHQIIPEKKPKFHQFPETLFDSAINHDDCNVLLAAHSRQVRLDSSACKADSWVFISWIFWINMRRKVFSRETHLSRAGENVMPETNWCSARRIDIYDQSLASLSKKALLLMIECGGSPSAP